ncbi:hypothetical protein [Micromonospora sonchi]|nr:hypothetical protein [Micromonospora sonchi]
MGAPTQGRTVLAALREASLCAYRLGHPYAGTWLACGERWS